MQVVVNEKPATPTIQTNGPICEGESMVLSTSSQCITYRWIGPSGSSPSTLNNPLLTTATNTTTIPMGDDAYQAGMWALICVDSIGCESDISAEIEMIINEIPATPTPTNTGSVCANAPFELQAGGSYPSTAIYLSLIHISEPTRPY